MKIIFLILISSFIIFSCDFSDSTPNNDSAGRYSDDEKSKSDASHQNRDDGDANLIPDTDEYTDDFYPDFDNDSPISENNKKDQDITIDDDSGPLADLDDLASDNDESEDSTNDDDTEIHDTDSYTAIEHLKDDELIKALYKMIEPPHIELGYSGARDKMYNYIDVNNGMIECYYTGEKVSANGSTTPGGFNTEHSWPQSQFDKKEPARGDIHHLFPTKSAVNSARGSYDFGEIDDPSDYYCSGETCSYRGISAVTLDTVFEVREKRRGDIARAHFYMVARYKHSTSIPIDDSNKTSYGCNDEDSCIDNDEEAVLRKWHIEDPVDDFERARNNRIENNQGNRNPFVDRPDFVENITDF